ncbi:MAG: nucleotidyltransferase domain-containing protein [Bacillota bacterium]
MAQLTIQEQKILDKVINHLAKVCNDQLVTVILYGSKARGNFTRESDIDLLIIVRDRNEVDRDKLYDFLLDEGIDYNLNFSLNIYDVKEFQRLSAVKAPFAMSVMEDGETLWTN